MRDDKWEESLMVHDWPEHGAGRLHVESLYQMFKERLIRELQASRHIEGSCYEKIPLEDSADCKP